MTAAQRRRLEALFAAVAPCLGCVKQDLVDTESLFPDPDPDSELRDCIDRLRQAQGLGPSDRPSEAEFERQRAETQARKDRLTSIQRKVLRTVPPAKRRTSCPECVVRKRDHDELTALAQRLSHSCQLMKEAEEFKATFDYEGSES